MADSKLDLPDDLIPTKASNRPAAMKVEALGGNYDKLDESKDQGASESIIPLSPQWLYAKPTETKMDTRLPNSLPGGNSVEPNPKEVWRLEGSEEKKDWRRIATESDTSRRWHEEERETSLLGGRRERRKGRNDGVSSRETTENRALSASERWHDGNTRNPGHDSRRDSKWSSRWGPEDREKELRTEKRTNVEKEKEDAHENQSLVSSNRPGSERDTEQNDKWRPRHRMEAHLVGSAYSRAAPGFGVDRGRVESSNHGFSMGRGRSTSIGRSSGSPVSVIHYSKGQRVPGRPNMWPHVFHYPRGKLLDIYRDQKHGPSFTAMPVEMEELPPITQKGFMEPLAFVTPNAEEEVLLDNIWKGKDTCSGVAYSTSRTGNSTENSSDFLDFQFNKEKSAQVQSEDSVGMLLTAPDDSFIVKAAHGEERVDSISLPSDSDVLIPSLDVQDSTCNEVQTGAVPDSSERKALDFSTANHPQHDKTKSALSSDMIRETADNQNSQYSFGSSGKSNGQLCEKRNQFTGPVDGIPPEEFTLCYIDPQGNVQGPFLGADIITWLEEGFFGTDLMVRLADSAEGIPFQELGELMPHLKVKRNLASSSDLNFELEEFSAFEGKVDATSVTPTPALEYVVSSAKGDTVEHFSEFDRPSTHTQLKISGPDKMLKSLHTDRQGFDDFPAQDEEIVFPGRSKKSSLSIPEASAGIPLFVERSASNLSQQNESNQLGLSSQNDSKLQRFGLLWSEIEDSQLRNYDSNNLPSAGRAASFNPMTEAAVGGNSWSDVHRKNTVNFKSYQDPVTARNIPHIERELDHFDLADRLLSQQLQQQHLQQKNIVSHIRGDESIFEHVTNQNLIHQRHLSNRSVSDLEHLVALQMQQQQHQFQQQQQLQLQHQLQQQQQIQHHQKLLQERQQSQLRQAVLEQLHRQIPKSGHGQSHADLIHPNNILDQVLLEQQLLHEMQQPHHSSRHSISALERLAANFGQLPHQENQGDLFDIVSHPRHGMPSLEHQLIQQEQLQRQISLKHHNDERFLESTWPSDQNSHFHSSHSGVHRVQQSGFNPLEFYQQHQRPLHEEQLSQFDRNLSLREQVQHGLFESSSLPFERSLSLPSGASDMDLRNAIAHTHGLDLQEPSMHLPSDQVGAFSSRINAHNIRNPSLSNQFHSSQFDPIEGRWSENTERLGNDWLETQIQAMNICGENKRESQVKMVSESPALWMSEGLSDDKSRQLLMDLLHQKAESQPTESLDRSQSGIYPGSRSFDPSLSVLADHDATLRSSLPAGYGLSASEQQASIADRQGGFAETSVKSLFRSESEPFSEGENFRSRFHENVRPMYTNISMNDVPYMSSELPDANWMNQGAKNESLRKVSSFEVRDGIARKGELSSTEQKTGVESISRHPSLVMGFYNDQIASSNSLLGDDAKDSLKVPPKSQENILLRRPSVSSMSSQEGFSEVAYDPVGRARTPSGNDAGKQDLWANLSNQGSEVTPSKKDMRFRRTSSYGEADVSDTSFIDMLKSNNTKKNAAMESAHVAEATEGTQGKVAGKKKGKKGRQIDPALLGFKVTSNRIMMGEIQRLDD